MPSWFKSVVQYTPTVPDEEVGNSVFEKQVKTVTEVYLFDAMTHTEAEAYITTKLPSRVDGYFVKDLLRAKYSDVFLDHAGDAWYEVKVDTITENERTGKEKRIHNTVLINADSNEQANARVTEVFKKYLDPFEVVDVKKTKIIEVYPYEAPLVSKSMGNTITVEVDENRLTGFLDQ